MPLLAPSSPFDNIYSDGDCLEVKRGNIVRTILCWQRAASSMGTVNRNSSYSPVGPWVCLFVCFFRFNDFFLFVHVLFYLGQLSHFPSCFGAGVTNLNEPPSSFLLLPHYWRLGASSIPLRAIVNKKQCETRGVIYVAGHPLLNKRYTRLPEFFHFSKRH